MYFCDCFPITNTFVCCLYGGACLSGNGVAHINEVILRRARLVLGWMTVCDFESRSHQVNYLINNPGQLSLAIPPWVDAVSTSDSHGHC